MTTVREKEDRIKKRQKNNHDSHHRTKTLQPPEPDCDVWIPDRKKTGTIIEKAETPPSYVVETPSTIIRRNRRHLIRVPPKNTSIKQQETTKPTEHSEPAIRAENNGGYYTRSGRLSIPPERLTVGK